MAVHIFQAYIHPKTKNTNYWCETASLKLREMLLNKTFQVQIDSKENHNPYVGCPQYKCKKLSGEKFNMMQYQSNLKMMMPIGKFTSYLHYPTDNQNMILQ